MDDATATGSHPTWQCRIGMHKYVKAVTDEGVAYLVCAHCRKESERGGVWASPMT